MNSEFFGNGAASGAIWVTFGSLLVFGYIYNRIINWLHRAGYNDGFTWLEVVIGVLVVVLAAGFTIGWGNVLLMIMYFASGGFFMAGGDIMRYVKARRIEHSDHDETT